jgi:hypothetical protein
LLDLAALELAGPRSVAAMSGSALHLSGSAAPVRQRYNFGSVFVFFLTQQLEEKEWEREKFGHLLSSVPTSFVLALSVVRNAKLPPTTPVATVVTRSLRQQQHEFQKHKKFVAFNMKQQRIEFF